MLQNDDFCNFEVYYGNPIICPLHFLKIASVYSYFISNDKHVFLVAVSIYFGSNHEIK